MNGTGTVFGNSGYRWKLGAALAVIAGLGVYSAVRGDPTNPSVWRCLAEPSRWDGKHLWIPAASIVAVHDRDYEVHTGAVDIRVSGPAPAPKGTRIALTAVFRADGPVLEPLKSRILPIDDRTRRLMEIISVLVTLAVLANFARHFLFRPEILQIERETG